jgi:Secretion system C-terminal sorting domain
MKTTYCFLSIAAATLLSATSIAQAINCDLFTITSIEPDSLNANNTIINIQMAGNSNDFINYPVIPTVWDCDDNVVSSGTLFFFGQFGQTTQGYPVNTLNDNICFPITVQFVYGDEQLVNDTCLLTFGSGLSIQRIAETDFTVFPNPTSGDVQLGITEGIIGTHYTLIDANGREVLSGTFRQGTTTLSLATFPAGVYMLRCSGYTRRIIKE